MQDSPRGKTQLMEHLQQEATPVVNVKGLVKDYHGPEGTLRLYNGLTVHIGKGDFVSVTGGIGWGKSTLVNIILGIESPTRGVVEFDGLNSSAAGFATNLKTRRVVAIFQRSTLVPRLSVIRNLQVALSLSNVAKAERHERIDEALHFFGLAGLAAARPIELSAGQKRRVDLARALATRPEFLILDEPAGDLDTSTTNILLPLLKGMNRDHGTTVLMMTAIPRIASYATRQVHLVPPTRTREAMMEGQK